MDNSVDVLLASNDIAKRAPLRADWDSRPLLAEHGFSTVLSLETGGKSRKVLFDGGLDPNTAAQNAAVLNLDLSDCDSVISSHGHIDHAGGLLNIKDRLGKRRIPLLLHPHAFRNRFVRFPDGKAFNLRPPNRLALSGSGYDIVEKTGASLWIDDSLLVTGQIPRTNDFEKGMPIHYSEIDGKLEPDPLIEDDQAIVFNLRDKGLVIITGCAHAGLINTLSYAKELTGEDRVYAVLGGMHLTGGLFEKIIPRTIEELRKLEPGFMIPCHCSGVRAVQEIMNEMPDSFIQNSVGTTYTF
ncbi:MAG: MBL fold metallo-hydrolase [Thaumarchaeota archaeon]|nr:MBL fold metallo-hydrolase [Nitrososphaerota archaeon]